MPKGLVEFWAAFDEDLVGSLLQRNDDNGRIDELALDRAQLVVPTARVVVHDGDKVVPNVPFLLVGLRVLLVVRHQSCDVEDNLNKET